MTFHLDTLRRSHQRLQAAGERLGAIARELPHTTTAGREELLAEALRRLHDEVLPTVDGEEHTLHRELPDHVARSEALAAMQLDRIAIRTWIDRLADTSPTDSVERAQELLYGLQTLLAVHVWKEERLYADVLAAPPWPHGA